MKKLLHERLRDVQASTGLLLCDLLVKTLGIPREKTDICTNRVPAISEAIALEIEKYYDPKPRDPEGNPVHKDMEVDGGVVKHWSVSEDGSWTIFDDDYEEIQCGDKNEPIRLPEPKVLDADGVEIKVGDTVWLTTSGKKLRVDGFTPWKYVRCSNPEIDGDHEAGLNFAPESLTHREPDSLEKILEDMMVDNHIRGTSYIRRIQSLMERDA